MASRKPSGDLHVPPAGKPVLLSKSDSAHVPRNRDRARSASKPLPVARVAAATVWLPKTKGRGVLVPGGFILTAAHCVNWEGTGSMALGDYFVEEVVAADGTKFLASVAVVEPVADIAVLWAMDNQAAPDEAERFEAFCERTEPVWIASTLEPKSPVLIRNKNESWTKGQTPERLIDGRKVCIGVYEKVRKRSVRRAGHYEGRGFDRHRVELP